VADAGSHGSDLVFIFACKSVCKFVCVFFFDVGGGKRSNCAHHHPSLSKISCNSIARERAACERVDNEHADDERNTCISPTRSQANDRTRASRQQLKRSPAAQRCDLAQALAALLSGEKYFDICAAAVCDH